MSPPKLAMSMQCFYSTSTPSSQFTSGDNARLLPNLPDTQKPVTPKFNSSNGNMAFAKLRRTQSLARPMTRTAFLKLSHNSLSSPYSQPFHESCSTNPNYIFMLQIKAIPKNTFRLSASYFFLILSFIYPTSFSKRPHKLSEETTQREHTHYTIFLAKTITNFSSPKTRNLWGFRN